MQFFENEDEEYGGEDFLEPEIREYIDFTTIDEQDTTGFLTKDRIEKHRKEWEETLELFLAYPDYFIDLITPRESHFRLFFFQRILLRAMARGVNGYYTFSRGTSKSFLADISQYLTCMLIPHHNATITAGSNKQAAEIAKQKITEDLWVKFPFLSNEMQKRVLAGKLLDPFVMGQDYVEFHFQNGSSLGLGNVRGLRKESLIFEEVIEQNEVTVNEVYIPLLNKPRTMANGLINPNEPQSQQIYITTAGYQGTFAYNKAVEIFCRSIIDPAHYFFYSGTYRIPLSLKLTSPKQIEDVVNSPTFTKESFGREYESRWSNAPKGAAFTANTIDAVRTLRKVELKDTRTHAQLANGDFYVVCADMAKDGSADTAVGVARVTPKEHNFTYKFVNLFTISSTDYQQVANVFKRTVLAYNASLLIYDANGVGAGIRDWLNKTTPDAAVGTTLPGFGIINAPESATKDLISYPKDRTICYEIKSGGKIGEHIHWFFFSRISSGCVIFPIKMADAVNLYSNNKSFMSMSETKKAQYFSPFKTMDLMEAELKNLDIVDSSDKLSSGLRIARRSNGIQKDFFSMAEYLVYGVNQQIEMNYYKVRNRAKAGRVLAFID